MSEDEPKAIQSPPHVWVVTDRVTSYLPADDPTSEDEARNLVCDGDAICCYVRKAQLEVAETEAEVRRLALLAERERIVILTSVFLAAKACRVYQDTRQEDWSDGEFQRYEDALSAAVAEAEAALALPHSEPPEGRMCGRCLGVGVHKPGCEWADRLPLADEQCGAVDRLTGWRCPLRGEHEHWFGPQHPAEPDCPTADASTSAPPLNVHRMLGMLDSVAADCDRLDRAMPVAAGALRNVAHVLFAILNERVEAGAIRGGARD